MIRSYKKRENMLLMSIGVLAIVAVALFGFLYYKNQNSTQNILQLSLTGPSTAAMGEEISYTVHYKNTSTFELLNPMLIFELPDNSLTEDNKTMFSQNLKNMFPGAQGTVQFTTRLFGKEGDIALAHASLLYTPKNLTAQYESDTTFSTQLSSIPLTLNFTMPTTAQAGKEFDYSINYFSNIDYPLENMSIKVDPMTGYAITSANPLSLDDVEWKLGTLSNAAGGKISMKGQVAGNAPSQLQFMAHLGMWVNGSFIVIKDISQSVTVSGGVQAPANQNQGVPSATTTPSPVTAPTSTSNVNSHVAIVSKAYFAGDSNFENSGPVPPQVGVPTSYTIIWNTSSDLHQIINAKVTATLPSNVTLKAILPDSQVANVSLDPATHQLVWLPGNIPAHAMTDVPPSLALQVTLTPSSSDQGSPANLMGQVTILGQDVATGASVFASAPAVTTSLPDDASNSGGGIVH